MHKLILCYGLAALSLAACSDDKKSSPTPDASVSMGTPRPSCTQVTAANPAMTHAQLINACVDSSVTVIVKYTTLEAEQAALPLLGANGDLPPAL